MAPRDERGGCRLRGPRQAPRPRRRGAAWSIAAACGALGAAAAALALARLSAAFAAAAPRARGLAPSGGAAARGRGGAVAREAAPDISGKGHRERLRGSKDMRTGTPGGRGEAPVGQYGDINKFKPYGNQFPLTVEEMERMPMIPRRIPDPIQDPLVAALRNKADVEERRGAAAAFLRLDWVPTGLGNKAKDETKEALFEALTDDDREVRWDAAWALSEVFQADRFGADPWVARMAFYLGKNHSEVDAQTRVAYLEAFAVMCNGLKYEYDHGDFIYEPYAGPIGWNLLHSEPRVRFAALEAIGKFYHGRSRWRGIITKMARSEPNETVRSRAEVILHEMMELTGQPGWDKSEQNMERVRNKKWAKGKWHRMGLNTRKMPFQKQAKSVSGV